MNKVADSGQVLVARPKKTVVGCWIAAIAVVAVSVLAATGMSGMTEGGGVFHSADAYAMVGLGLAAAVGILLFARPRVWAGASGVKVRNLVSTVNLPWEVVRSVAFPRGASWAVLELADDDVVPVMAIQAVDGEYALTAVRKLRELLAESNSA